MPYPVMDNKPLDPAARKGLFRLGGRVRDDVPRTLPHQALVYRVDGRYRLDGAGLGPSHEDVVNASHVTIVDTSRDRPVDVEFDIPSREADPFRITVTFLCTVTDAVAVVRDGLSDVSAALLAHLRCDAKIFQVGLDYQVTQVNEVRRDANAEIVAYATLCPPSLPGMTVTVAGVDVATPAVVRELEKRRRELRDNYTLDTDKEGYDQDLEDMRRRHQHERDVTEMRHTQGMAVSGQHHELLLRQEKGEFDRRDMEAAMRLLDADPAKALQYAFAAGELSARDLARQLQEDQERSREDQRRREDRQHQERMAEIEWSRASQLRSADQELEDQRIVRNIKVEVLRDLVKRGHLDMVNLDSLTSELLGDLKIGAGEPAPALESGSDSETGSDDPAEPSVREEDGD